MSEKIKYCGSCHCGAVKFEILAPEHLKVIDCNCSVCRKKQNRHFILPAENFKLLTGQDCLTTYTFNTNTAQHKFCSKCGVQSFYYPRSNPDGVAVMPHCLDSPNPKSVSVENFDGNNWEASMGMGIDIQNRSLPSK